MMAVVGCGRRSYRFHTIIAPRVERTRSRSSPAPFLTMSLSSLFDISQPTDCLRAALNMLTEYEQAKEENDRPKMHLRFPLDYTQTLLSLLDILSAFYVKLLGPLALPNTCSASRTPIPTQAFLTSSIIRRRQTNHSVASPSVRHGTAGPDGPPGPLNSPPPSWTPALGEHVVKVNGKFKKIIAVLLKDLDVFARDSIEDELASLDSLLRKVGGWSVPVGNGDEGRATYEFDPEH
ncbi:hypothetical protein BGW80DRAFT_577809 [Lactifluus volemus]|nr:hypothetical protein BGW80DRAFT_577809 [Lactifluus volemus]